MKNFLPVLLLFFSSFLFGQQVLYDFEKAETSTTFQIFGGNLEGVIAGSIPNPDPSGENTSANVLEAKKAADAPTWGGMFANPKPKDGINCENGGQVCMDVWMDHIGKISLKLETADPNDPNNYRQQVANTKVNQWERICFDLGANSLDGNMTPATGKIYTGLVIFPDFGTAGNGTEQVYYIDNITIPDQPTNIVCTTLYDFETPETSVEAPYFGSDKEGTSTTVAPNPNVSGVNTSGNVMHYIRGGNAQTWAGAAIVLDTILNTNDVYNICIKFLSDNEANMTLKLEMATFDNPENWIGTVQYTTPGQWQDLCFDIRLPSFEGAMTPGILKDYLKIILFPDFGKPGNGSDVDFFLDDIIVKSDKTPKNYDVTFAVDMKGSGVSFNTMYISGSFNGWNGESNPLSDADGDGIWTTTINLPPGKIEYLFTYDNWAGFESFNGTDVCTTPVSAQFKNRVYNVSKEDVLNPVCFNSCYACGNSVNLTWNLNMSQETVSGDGVFLAGGAYFGHGNFPMKDEDGDGTYSITLRREKGFTTHYTFINGICLPDWSCKENIAGQDCADPNNFNDRFLEPTFEDVTFNTCFAKCTTDGSCVGAEPQNVTFNVDMSKETVSGGLFLAGGAINGWNPTATEMTDTDGDKIYSVQVQLLPGLYEYKYVNGSQWESLASGLPCTITDPSGQFVNRLLILPQTDTILNAVFFGSCDLSTATDDEAFGPQGLTVYPSPAGEYIEIGTGNIIKGTANITDLSGRNLATSGINGQKTSVHVGHLTPGIYFVKVVSGGNTAIRKFVKN